MRERLLDLTDDEREVERLLNGLAGYIRQTEKNGQSLAGLLNRDPEEYAQSLIEQPTTNDEYRKRYHILIEASDELTVQEKAQAIREFDWAIEQLDEAKQSLHEIEVRDVGFLVYTKIEALKASRSIWNRMGWLIGIILAFAYGNLLLVIDDLFSLRLFTAPLGVYAIDYLSFLVPVLLTGAIFGLLARFRHRLHGVGRRIAFALFIVLVYVGLVILVQPLLLSLDVSFIIQLTPVYSLVLLLISGFMAVWTLLEFVWKSTRCPLGDDTLRLYY